MSENLKSILFTNKQYLECKIDYEDIENKYNLTSFYVKIDDEWILTKKEKIKKTRFDNLINKYKLTYEYMLEDFHIEIPFKYNKDTCGLFMNENLTTNHSNFTYDNINKLINNINKIPYHKHSIEDGICLATSNKYKTKLLTICENTFSMIYKFIPEK